MMSNTLQNFLADATVKTADALVEAFLRLPEQKRDWKPAESSRSALDQLAECALNNAFLVNIVETRQWTRSFEDYLATKAALVAEGPDAAIALLKENTPRAIATIRAFPSDSLDEEITLPFGTSKMSEVLAYPYWNMAYHEGQINYIASILNLL
jgi:hypothetical protein